MTTYNISPKFDRNRFFIVNFREIEERLDPFFYKPIFRDLSPYKVEFQKLKSLAKSINHPPEYERVYSADGYQLLRAQNVRPTGIEIDNNQVFFSEDFLKGKNLFIPEIGDILVVRSGVNAGDTAVVENKFEKVIIGADNLLIKVNEKIIPKFLQVFFYTAFGKNLMSRYLTGATNKHINPFNLGKIPIPIVDRKTQEKAIQVFENVLLRKQQNEAAAEKILASIDDYLLKELGITLPETPENSLKNRMFTTTIKTISGYRFDPFYHQKIFDSHKNPLSKYPTKKIKEISEEIKTGLPVRKDFRIDGGAYPYYGANGIIGFMDEFTHDGLYLVIGQDGYIGKHYVVKGKFWGSNHNWVLKLRDGYDYHFIKSILDVLKYDYLITGGVIPKLTKESLESIRVPVPPIAKQKEIADHITGIKQQAHQLKEKTKEVLSKASQEIEKILLA